MARKRKEAAPRRVRVTAGTVTDGVWKAGRGRFTEYHSDGHVFPTGGFREMDEDELTDAHRDDPCLRIVPVEDPRPEAELVEDEDEDAVDELPAAAEDEEAESHRDDDEENPILGVEEVPEEADEESPVVLERPARAGKRK